MSNPTCSHCGYEFDEEETWHHGYSTGDVSSGECDVSELKCPNQYCGKTFYVRCVHTISWEQCDEDGDDLI